MTEEFKDPHAVPSLLSDPDARAFSIVTFGDGWVEDFTRLARSLASQSGDLDYEIVAVCNASDDLRKAAEEAGARVIHFTKRIGFGAGRNAGIAQSRGEVVVIADTSIEPTGDILSPIAGVLADPTVGMCGPWGLVTKDMRSFQEGHAGEVDAIQAYCMAFRRNDVLRVGMFDPKYKFYRNADLDFSMRWRAAGYRLLAVDLPIARHEHRAWESMSEAERERKSRENFSRFLRAWKDSPTC